ncbi:hypothetical protein CONLIGDRAFT_417124 [Coniochaeta ligniaria NRRL 30616]|uniref:Uncharacterized protein n=1 Tax=Coniochaeta ligniaria NRRL 30616 TaxID=1408157 RepID=A0A1J7IIT2_9PEZI|nr:hypothetical protein CONLIGDRAFT_417124 [Coniochaeta ligniaria NRRL 30616]
MLQIRKPYGSDSTCVIVRHSCRTRCRTGFKLGRSEARNCPLRLMEEQEKERRKKRGWWWNGVVEWTSTETRSMDGIHWADPLGVIWIGRDQASRSASGPRGGGQPAGLPNRVGPLCANSRDTTRSFRPTTIARGAGGHATVHQPEHSPTDLHTLFQLTLIITYQTGLSFMQEQGEMDAVGRFGANLFPLRVD